MLRLLTLAFAAFLLAIVPAPTAWAQSPERLTNPGFEEGLTGWARQPWFAGVADVEDTVKHSGTGAFHFVGVRQGPYIQQDVAAVPLQPVSLSGWINVQAFSAMTMDGAIELQALNSNWGVIETRRLPFTGVTNGWEQVSLSWVLPANTTLLRTRVYFAILDGAVFIDDFSLTGGAPTEQPQAGTATVLPTSSRTVTPSRTATFTKTLTPSRTPTLTRTPTNTRTSTPTRSPTVTSTPTRTATPTLTPSPSVTPAPTQTTGPSPTVTNTLVPTPTLSPTASLSPTVTLTATTTATPSTTLTPTPSFTPTPPVPPTEPASGERLINGGFEGGLNAWERPIWWADKLDLDTSTVHTGATGLHFIGKGSSHSAQQTVVATAGETIQLTGWVNFPDHDAGTQSAIQLRPMRASNYVIFTQPVYPFLASTTTDGWQQFSVSVVMPPETAQVQLRLFFPDFTGVIFFDDFSITGTAPAPTPTPTVSPTAVLTPPPANHTYYGAWVGSSVNVVGDEAAFEQAMVKQRAIRHWYWSVAPLSANAANFPSWSTSMPQNAVLMLSWAPSPVDSDLDSVLDGTHDAYITAWAHALRDYQREVWLRMMWEDNGSWFWWKSGGDAEKYKQAFRHVVDIMRAEGASNVKFVWSPVVRAPGLATPINSYPGAAYVDRIGLDGYPFRSGTGDFFSVFNADYTELGTLGKPMMVAETAVSVPVDSDRAAKISHILQYELPYRFPNFTALVWFSEPTWGDLLDPSHPLTREAFRQGIGIPFYTGR